jgi:hypothetical protein
MECREPKGVVRQRGKVHSKGEEEEGLEKKTGTEKEKKLAGLGGLVLLGNVLGFSRRGAKSPGKRNARGTEKNGSTGWRRDGEEMETAEKRALSTTTPETANKNRHSEKQRQGNPRQDRPGGRE